jgi:two-component system, OmpR family, copper resistance phosphate regulon response regulator CusR
MPSILLIEDESSVANFILKGLTETGYEVTVAFTGAAGVKLASENNFDLIILDIMLPDRNGIEVCGELRSFFPNLPILFLTALGSAANVAMGLDSGGDDYLVKPFKFIELHARIKALLRRADHRDVQKSSDSVFALGDLIVNDDAKTVKRGDRNIELTATEFRLLIALLKNKGKVMSRVDLLENVWGITFNLGTNVVDVYINYLRKKIDADPATKLIHTVIGMGYTMKEA